MVIFNSYVKLPEGMCVSQNWIIPLKPMFPYQQMIIFGFRGFGFPHFEELPVPILDTLQEKYFLAGERRYSH